MSDIMKNVVFTGVKKIEVQEHKIPELDDDKVLVKVDACAICTWEQRVYTGLKKVDFPFIGGHELSGTVAKIGKNAEGKNLNIGDKVVVGLSASLACKNCAQCKSGNEQNCENFDHSRHLKGLPHKGMGGLSSHLMMAPQDLFPYEGITPEEATITEPISCVLRSVETAQVEFGDVAVVIGCGIMGLLHLILAKYKGASVIAVDINDERLELAKQLGASSMINPDKERLYDKIKELTSGEMAQVVFDTTPISKVAEDAVKLVANNGRMVLYSSFYPDTPISISPDWLHKSAAKLMGTANSSTSDYFKAVKLLSQGTVDVKPFISEVYDLKDINKAFESASKGDKYRVIIRF